MTATFKPASIVFAIPEPNGFVTRAAFLCGAAQLGYKLETAIGYWVDETGKAWLEPSYMANVETYREIQRYGWTRGEKCVLGVDGSGIAAFLDTETLDVIDVAGTWSEYQGEGQPQTMGWTNLNGKFYVIE